MRKYAIVIVLSVIIGFLLLPQAYHQERFEDLDHCDIVRTTGEWHIGTDSWGTGDATFGCGGGQIPDDSTSITCDGTVNRMVAQGRYVYVACEGYGLNIINLTSDPITKAGAINKGGGKDVAVQGKYAYLVTGDSLVVLDVSNPASISRTGAIAHTGTAVEVRDNYVYIADGTTGLVSVDVSNKNSPSLADSVSWTSCNLVDVDLEGNFLSVNKAICFDFNGGFESFQRLILDELRSGREHHSDPGGFSGHINQKHEFLTDRFALTFDYLTVEIDQDGVDIIMVLPLSVPIVERVSATDLDSAAEPGIMYCPAGTKRLLRAGLSIDHYIHSAKDGVSLDFGKLPGLIGKDQLCSVNHVFYLHQFHRSSGPAVFGDDELLSPGADTYFSRSQAEDAHTRRVLGLFHGLVPVRIAQIQQLGEIVNSTAVVTDRDQAILVGDSHFSCSGTPGVLKDLDDPSVQRPGKESVGLRQ